MKNDLKESRSKSPVDFRTESVPENYSSKEGQPSELRFKKWFNADADDLVLRGVLAIFGAAFFIGLTFGLIEAVLDNTLYFHHPLTYIGLAVFFIPCWMFFSRFGPFKNRDFKKK